jgi:hypothetical protein
MICRIKPEFAKYIAWPQSNMPPRTLCGLCHGPLPVAEVPLMAWRDNGASVALCDVCVEEVLEIIE